MWGQVGEEKPVRRDCFRVALPRHLPPFPRRHLLSASLTRLYTMLRDELAQLRRLGIRHVRPPRTILLRRRIPVPIPGKLTARRYRS